MAAAAATELLKDLMLSRFEDRERGGDAAGLFGLDSGRGGCIMLLLLLLLLFPMLTGEWLLFLTDAEQEDAEKS